MASFDRLVVKSADDLDEFLAKEKTNLVVDVRTNGEYGNTCKKGGGHFCNAMNVPLHLLVGEDGQQLQAVKESSAGAEVACYCAGGFRSLIAATLLRRQGIRTTDVPGGFATIREKALEKVVYSE